MNANGKKTSKNDDSVVSGAVSAAAKLLTVCNLHCSHSMHHLRLTTVAGLFSLRFTPAQGALPLAGLKNKRGGRGQVSGERLNKQNTCTHAPCRLNSVGKSFPANLDLVNHTVPLSGFSDW